MNLTRCLVSGGMFNFREPSRASSGQLKKWLRKTSEGREDQDVAPDRKNPAPVQIFCLKTKHESKVKINSENKERGFYGDRRNFNGGN